MKVAVSHMNKCHSIPIFPLGRCLLNFKIDVTGETSRTFGRKTKGRKKFAVSPYYFLDAAICSITLTVGPRIADHRRQGHGQDPPPPYEGQKTVGSVEFLS